MHLVHKPTLRTPDTSEGTKEIDKLYDDNIRYMDKQVGALVAELEKQGLRQNTLIIFSGDNGTAAGYPSPVQGRMINGCKGSMLEGGSRVPFIASWPGVTPAGKVLNDIVSFADPYATFAELAGVKPPEGFKTDGQSFAPQLRGEPGTPRAWAYVQLGGALVRARAGIQAEREGRAVRHERCPVRREADCRRCRHRAEQGRPAAARRGAGGTESRRRQDRRRRTEGPPERQNRRRRAAPDAAAHRRPVEVGR